MDSPVKKKFWVQWSVKKLMLTVPDMKRSMTIDFLEKSVTVNNASYSQSSIYSFEISIIATVL